MDTKAMAKSKRAHTQHHSKKPHSVHKPKAAEKLQGNQTKTPVQSRLPSNFDRYDDEHNLNASDDCLSTSSQPADAIVPKSKGADYVHLISEAQAESHSKIDINSDCLDDLLHDEFSRAVGSMISARGEGILSWMEDDNFVVVEEDGSASNHEEPRFLSLDLNALEKMLEKVDVHERLYIDADLLPPELRTAQSKVSRDKEPCHSHVVTTRLNEPLQEESSGKTDSIVALGESSVLEAAESIHQVKDMPILTERSSAIKADLDLLLNSFSEEPNPVASASSHKASVQRSSAFETELDSLLNSHGGSELANPSDQKLNTTGFGDVLGDLLGSTSSSTKPQGNQNPSSSTVGKSKVLDEFDSWLDTI